MTKSKLLLLLPLFFLGGCITDNKPSCDTIDITIYRNTGKVIEVHNITTDSVWRDGEHQYVNDVVNEQTYVCPLDEFNGIDFHLP